MQEYSYVYNGGTLMQMVIETTVDEGEPLTEVLSFSYDASGIPMSVVYNGTAYFYTVNLQGDVMAIVDATGNAVVSYAYDAWGNILSVTGTMADTLGQSNPLRYRGFVYDHETGLYYLQSRYYDPELGRFINADGFTSTGQGIIGNNMFAYCCNLPTCMIDYTGTDPYELFDSEDDAAIDFANCYNAISIENQKEYGATIYKCIIKEIKIFKITITTRFCNSEIKFTHFFTMPVYVTKYYYTTPLAGFKDFVIPNLFGIGQLVAIVHTHGNYIDSYGSGNDNFSTGLLSDIG